MGSEQGSVRRRELRRLRNQAQDGLTIALGKGHVWSKCGRWPAPPSDKQCEGQEALPLDTHIDAERSRRTGEAYVGRVQRCYNGLGCPWCSTTAGAHYGDCLATSVARASIAGWTSIMFTITVPHRAWDSLERVQDVLDRLTAYLLNRGRSKVNDRLLDAWGGREHAMVTEWMHAERSGWHPHAHGLLQLGAELDDEEIDDLETALAHQAVAWLKAEKWYEADPNLVVTFCRVRDGRGVADYLTKIGWELGGGSIKAGRSGESSSVHGLAVRLAEIVGADSFEDALACERRGEAVARIRGLLREWEAATKRRHLLVTSRGWWGRWLPEVEERNVRQVVAAGRKLEVRDRQMVRDAAAALAEHLGVEIEEDHKMSEEYDVPEEEEGSDRVLSIERPVWAEFDQAVRARLRGYRLVLPVLQRAKYGSIAVLCELIEDFGPLEAARMIAATLPDAPPIWQAGDGTLVIARNLHAGHTLTLVEDWGTSPSEATWLDRAKERRGAIDPDAERLAATNYRRALDAERKGR